MPNRFSSTPGKSSFREIPLPIPQLSLFASARLNGGMVTQLDPIDIEGNQLELAVNCDCRYDVLSRRTGLEFLTPAKPNSSPVIAIVAFKQFSSTISFLRFTPTTIHVRSAGSWSAIVPAVGLTATANNKIHFLSITDRGFFGNEVDPLQEINIGAGTCAAAGNAPAYKYYCAFGNRIVGANRVGGTPSGVEIGWSGDFNFTQWDPLVDISAGFTPLVDNPTDFADFITGLFSFTSVMVVMRERSIITATRQPIASNPFYFSTAVPSIGCDTPKSIAQIPKGLVWYDRRLNNVFMYSIGTDAPIPIGDLVRKTINAQVEDNDTLTGSYDPLNDEYLLAIPLASSNTSRVWKYNFKTQAWSYNEIDNVTSISALDFSEASTTINDLVGTIDSLVGMIDDLSPTTRTPNIFYGLSDGEIKRPNNGLTYDELAASGQNFYEMEVRSKIFKLNPNDCFVTQFHLDYVPQLAGNFILDYSVDGGETYKPYKTVTWTFSEIGKRLHTVCNKNVRASTFQWRLRSSAGLFDLIEYSAYAFTTDAYTRAKTT